MHVGARLVGGRHAIDGAGHLAVDQDDALVAFLHLGAELLHHEGLAEDELEHLDQRVEVGVVLADAEDGRAAVAVERLDDDVLVLGAEALRILDAARDKRRRHEIEKVEDEHFLGRIAHAGGIVDDERLGMDALQEMRRRDVGHVEGRVLAQQDDIAVGQRQRLGRP